MPNTSYVLLLLIAVSESMLFVCILWGFLRLQYHLYTVEAPPDSRCCYRNRLFHLRCSFKWSNWVNAEIISCKTELITLFKFLLSTPNFKRNESARHLATESKIGSEDNFNGYLKKYLKINYMTYSLK